MWVTILVSAALGAAGGAIGVVLTRGLSPKARRTTSVILGAIAISFGREVIMPHVRAWQAERDIYNAGLELFGSTESAELYSRLMGPVFSDSRYRAWLEHHGNSAFQASAQLTAAGLALLQPEDGERLFRVRRKLADVSPALCQGFWDGQIAATNLSAGLHQLPVSEQSAFIEVTARAAALELENGPGLPASAVPQAEVDRAMSQLMERLGSEGRAAFLKTARGAHLSPEEACAAFRNLTDTLPKLDSDARAVVIRTILQS
jgi:hypothetical protein